MMNESSGDRGDRGDHRAPGGENADMSTGVAIRLSIARGPVLCEAAAVSTKYNGTLTVQFCIRFRIGS